MKNVGVIGLGRRMGGVIGNILYDETNEVKVTAVTDINPAKVDEAIERRPEMYDDNLKRYTNADEMLDNEKLDGVFIGTNCNTHTDFAVKVIERGIPLFLEKPVSTTMDDLSRLAGAMKKYDPKVMVSFPLRYSGIASLAKEIIDSGKIGTVEQVQAFNDVPYGRVYYHSWYRDDSITGGLWLQKATHDLDCINYITGMKPVEICAMESKQIFKGNKPAGLKCSECPEYDTCCESPKMIGKRYNDRILGDGCCFAVDTGNLDSSSAIMRYETGMHAVYSQNFFARKKAGRRGARYYGYKGTLEFDWIKAEIKVYMHNTDRVDTYKFEGNESSHFGGDAIMIADFMDMLNGGGKSILKEGIESALMCLKARESCETKSFVTIPSVDNL